MIVQESLEQRRLRYRTEWWMLAAFWLAVGVVLVIALAVQRQETEAREREHLMQQARTIHDNLGRQLSAINRVLESVIEDLPRWHAREDGTAAINRRMRAYSGIMTGVRTMALLDADGMVLASSRPEYIGDNFSHRDYFIAARQAASHGTLVVSPPFRTAGGVWALNLARIVPGPDGGFGGIVAVTLDPDEFSTLLESVRYTPDMLTALLHGDGLRFLMAAEQPGQQGVNLAQSGTLLARHRDSGQETSVLRGVVEPGDPQRLVALHTIQPPALQMDKPLIAVAGREWRSIFADWRTTAWSLGGVYLLLGLTAAGGTAFMQRRRAQIWLQERALVTQAAALEARWRAVLHATQQGVWDWNVSTHKVFYSPAWKAMLGCAPEDIDDSLEAWQARIHPDDRERVRADMQRHIRGETPFYESTYRLGCKDGSYLWVLDRGRVIERDGAGAPLRAVGTYRDVSELRLQRERLERLTENVPGMLYQYQQEPDGRSHFPFVSNGVQDIYGCQPEELRQDVYLAVRRIHPDDLAQVLESVERSAHDLSIMRAEYRVILPGRGERWVSGQSRPQRLDNGAVLWHGYIHDITEAKQQSFKLQEAERLLKHLMDEMPIGLCRVDAQGKIYYRNRRFLELFGYSESEVPTLEQWRLKAYPDPAYRLQVRNTWNAAVARATEVGGEIQSEHFRIMARDGTQRTVAVGGIAYGGHFLATFVDHTEHQARSDQLQKLAYMDALTGVANRRYFEQTLQAEWRRCRRSKQPLSLVMIDIDYFKQLNDSQGHQKGDEYLQAVAAVLREGLGRSHDLVARYGGEEFVCLMPECDLDSARTKAQALCRAVQDLGLEHQGSPAASVVTISLGVACQVPSASTIPQELLARADANLYRAKAAGRNRVDAGEVALLKE